MQQYETNALNHSGGELNRRVGVACVLVCVYACVHVCVCVCQPAAARTWHITCSPVSSFHVEEAPSPSAVGPRACLH